MASLPFSPVDASKLTIVRSSKISNSIPNMSGRDAESLSIIDGVGVTNWDNDTGDGGLETPALKQAFCCALFSFFRSLSASISARLCSRASVVKFGLLDLVDDVYAVPDQPFSQDIYTFNYKPYTKLLSCCRCSRTRFLRNKRPQKVTLVPWILAPPRRIGLSIKEMSSYVLSEGFLFTTRTSHHVRRRKEYFKLVVVVLDEQANIYWLIFLDILTILVSQWRYNLALP